jgi:hypothetical protein
VGDGGHGGGEFLLLAVATPISMSLVKTLVSGGPIDWSISRDIIVSGVGGSDGAWADDRNALDPIVLNAFSPRGT